MKPVFLLFFIGLLTASYAQQHELSVFFQQNTDKNLGKGQSLNYYGQIGLHQALGIKLLYTVPENNYSRYDLKALGLDFTHRWNLSKREKVRFTFESGVAALYTFNEPSDGSNFGCNCSSFVPLPEAQDYLYLGYTAGLGFDVQVFKVLKLGIGYTLHNQL